MKSCILPDQQTDRLLLRQRTLADAPDMFEYASIPIVATNAGFPIPESVDFYKEWVPEWEKRMDEAGLPRGYGITIKGTDKVIGSVDFNRVHGVNRDIFEMGYILHPDYWGNGYIVEAAKALMKATFEMCPHVYKFEIACHSLNERSQSVARKLGFQLEATVRGRYEIDGIRCDELRFGLLRSEWEWEEK